MTKGQGNWESIRTIDFTLSGDTMLITNQQDTENAIGISYTTRANGFKKPQPLVIGRKIVSVAVHPNGELYYVKRKTGELIRFDMQTKEEKVLYALEMANRCFLSLCIRRAITLISHSPNGRQY